MIVQSFANDRKNSNIEPTVMNTNKVWFIEQIMIEIYLLLTHRIPGLGWTLNDFWEMDTWTTSKLYCTELDLIEKEENEYNNQGKNNLEDYNDPKTESLYKEMFGDEE